MNETQKDFLSVSEAMAYLGLARPTLYKYVSSGKLNVYKSGASGRKSFFKKSELDTLKEFYKVETNKTLLEELHQADVEEGSFSEAESETDIDDLLDRLESDYNRKLAAAG